jgi:hypothetical protein
VRTDDWEDSVHDLGVECGVSEDEITRSIQLRYLVDDLVSRLSHGGSVTNSKTS